MDVALVTCSNVPTLDSDDALLIPALKNRGIDAQPVIWNDPLVDWSAPKLSVLRSTWDYHHQRSAFLKWAEHVSQLHQLWNPYSILDWNTHKFYLRDLERQNIPIIPTLYLPRGACIHLSLLMAERHWQKVVIKPAVSASAYATLLITEKNLAVGQQHLDTFLSTHDMLLQPFQTAVTLSGERSLVFIDGEFTHAIKRMPALDLDPTGRDMLIDPDPDEKWLAQKVLSVVPSSILYARVDIVRDEKGIPCLMELELVEPGLWLSFAKQAVQRFADAIACKVHEIG